MDNIYLKIGSKFKGKESLAHYLIFLGIKHIPQGAHFVYYSLGDEMNMFKISFFIYAKPGEVIRYIVFNYFRFL